MEYNKLMLNRKNIKNTAVLTPRYIKCSYVQQTRHHAFVKTKDGYKQCVECGTIMTKERPHGLYKHNSSL
jgi:hypothetical protein